MKSLYVAASLAALAACPAFAGEIEAHHPYAFSTAKSAKAGGAYIHLMNKGAADRLLDARSEVARRVEIHEHRETDGVMRMRKVDGGIELPEGGAIEMKSGGYHVMLMGLAAPLTEGESFPVTLVFESGEELVVDVEVVARGAAPKGHSGHKKEETGHSGHGDHEEKDEEGHSGHSD